MQKDLSDQKNRASERLSLKEKPPEAAADKGLGGPAATAGCRDFGGSGTKPAPDPQEPRGVPVDRGGLSRHSRGDGHNRVDTQTLLDRIDGGIVAPLQQINTTTYTDVDQRIGVYRLREEQQTDPQGAISDALASVDNTGRAAQEGPD